MYIVSGCPRSGTSLMMDCLRAALGEDRILGSKFMGKDKQLAMLKRDKIYQRDNETPEEFSLRQYMFEKNKVNAAKSIEEVEKRKEHMKDMNPNGFYEMQFTVTGIKYAFAMDDLFKRIRSEGDSPYVCKVVSQGLIQSDPQYVDKIVYMIRHPRAVAKSQEKLIRPNRKKFQLEDGEVVEEPVHTPKMFIDVTKQAALWLEANKDKKVLIVEYDDLIEDPKKQFKRIKRFLGEGDFKQAEGIINPKLRRSIPQDIELALWDDAEYIYEEFKKRNFKKIKTYMEDPFVETNLEKTRIPCIRTGRDMAYRECKACHEDYVVRNNYKHAAETDGIDWENEPCVFECSKFVDDNRRVGVEESIKTNTWRDWVGTTIKKIERESKGKRKDVFAVEFPEFDVESDTFVEDITTLEDFHERIHMIYGVWFVFREMEENGQ